MPNPTRTTWLPIALLVALDALFVLAVDRLPSRVELAQPALDVPTAAPNFAAVTPTAALFLTTDTLGSTGRAVLSRVPFDGSVASARTVGQDLAVLDASDGIHWAWSGRTLLVAAAAGLQGVRVFTVAPDGTVSPPIALDGARPSAGWAHDHFEVAYVASAVDHGRVQRLLRVDERGRTMDDRVLAGPDVPHSALAWPAGQRAVAPARAPGAVALPDGTSVPLPAWRDARPRPWFELAADGSSHVRFARFVVTRGSPLIGSYTARTDTGANGVTVESRVGAHEPRPRYVVARADRRAAFETNTEARPRDLVVAERAGVLHVVDPHGFHARLRARDLGVVATRTGRLAWLAAAVGPGAFVSILFALGLAHALALFVGRAARPGRGAAAARLGRFAAASALLLGFGALIAVLQATPP